MDEERCIDFDLEKDECLTCDEIYFLSDDKRSCLDFPKGIFGC